MSFEIRHKDLLGRIGRLRTKKGVLETPLLLPVVNAASQLIPAMELREKFGFEAVITNSYLIWRRSRQGENVPTVHSVLGFDGVIETDSGAYQILQYGDVEVQPIEIIRFQEKLDSDMAVILDIPTGEEVSKERAKWTVDETIRRADSALNEISRKDILWVGPIQGGVFPDLVAYSAREIAKRDFPIHALGSPTPVMQQYKFNVLVDMIMAAKLNIPPNRPLHLFGAGHPMMFSLAVALGCDIFDSASYALFARARRYMTAQGTTKIDDMEYFPCNCPACYKTNPEKIRSLLLFEQEKFLASHNLFACFNELQTIKQSIVDGRLWELVESRSRNHPALQKAFRRMLEYTEELEKETPVWKKKGPLVSSSESLRRPEVLRHQARMLERYTTPKAAKTAILLPERYMEPFLEGPTDEDPLKKLETKRNLHLCSYGPTFGIVPQELLDVFPLSQTESAIEKTPLTTVRLSKRVDEYLRSASYRNCIIVVNEDWQQKVAISVKRKLKRHMSIRVVEWHNSRGKLVDVILRTLTHKRAKRIR